MDKVYENRYWEFSEEKNKFGERAHKLHFTEFYDDNVILGFVKETGDDDTYLYTSELLNVEYNLIIADSVEDAKE